MPSSTSSKSSIAPPSIVTVKDANGKPLHNDDDLSLPLFIDYLDRWLAEEHPNTYSYIENGFIVNRQGKVIVWSAEHAAALARRTDDTPEFSFKKPPVFRAATTTKMHDDHVDTYRVGREELKIMAKTLESIVVGRLTRGSADRIKSISKGDGGKALQALHTRLSSKSTEIDGALKVYYNAAVAAGLSEPTTAALDTYVENVTMWNDSRGDTRKDSEADISTHVVDAVRDLGDYIEGKLDIALHNKDAAKLDIVTSAARTVLNNKASKDIKNQAAGRVLAAQADQQRTTETAAKEAEAGRRALAAQRERDGKKRPRDEKKKRDDPNKLRPTKAELDGPYNSKWGKCRHCGKAEHWSRDCSQKPPPAASPAPAPAPVAGGAKAAAAESACGECAEETAETTLSRSLFGQSGTHVDISLSQLDNPGNLVSALTANVELPRSLCARAESTASATSAGGGGVLPSADGASSDDLPMQPPETDEDLVQESEVEVDTDASSPEYSPSEDDGDGDGDDSAAPAGHEANPDGYEYYALFGTNDSSTHSCPPGRFESNILPLCRRGDGYVAYGSSCNVDSFEAGKVLLNVLQDSRLNGEPFFPGQPCYVPFALANQYPGVRTDAPLLTGTPVADGKPVAAPASPARPSPRGGHVEPRANSTVGMPLSPISPMRDFRQYVSLSPVVAVRSVSLRTGGTDARSRLNIFADIRAAEAANATSTQLASAAAASAAAGSRNGAGSFGANATAVQLAAAAAAAAVPLGAAARTNFLSYTSYPVTGPLLCDWGIWRCVVVVVGVVW